MNCSRYEQRHENLSERAGLDGHFGKYAQIVRSCLGPTVNNFSKILVFHDVKFKMIAIAAIYSEFLAYLNCRTATKIEVKHDWFNDGAAEVLTQITNFTLNAVGVNFGV